MNYFKSLRSKRDILERISTHSSHAISQLSSNFLSLVTFFFCHLVFKEHQSTSEITRTTLVVFPNQKKVVANLNGRYMKWSLKGVLRSLKGQNVAMSRGNLHYCINFRL